MKISAIARRGFGPGQSPPVLDILLAASIALGACAQTEGSEERATRGLSPLEGYWRLAATSDTIVLEPCEPGAAALCGRLVAFEGDPDARDLLNPDLFAWGQKICNSTVVFDLTRTEETQIHAGRLYDPNEGEVLNLVLLMKSKNLIEARAYHGASVDEAIDLGVTALTGNVPVFDTISFATRASIGKAHLGETLRWVRSETPQHPCDAER